MNKQMLMLYIAISVFSLILIILTYIGYTRYMKLSLCSCESYAKSYEKLPRVQSDNKVIVSIFTRKDDINSIKTSINSLLDQTVHPDQIIISIPPNTENIKAPDYIKKNKIINIHKLSSEYGGSSNLISPILREKDGNALIILVSDDHAYGPDFVETLVDESKKHPDSIIYVAGYNSKIFSETGKKVDNAKENDIIEVSKGVLVKPAFFDSSIIEENDNIKDTPNLLLSVNAHKKGVKLHKVDYNENLSFNKNKDNEESSERNIAPYYAIHLPSYN